MPYICRNPGKYSGQVVGNGECVAFVKEAAGAPSTSYWKQGIVVEGNYQTIKFGTAIATFVDGKYPNKRTGNHAAIFVSGDAEGIVVWDQWVGRPVGKRTIRFKNGEGSPSNDASAFSAIE
jgi:hypothetical protein